MKKLSIATLIAGILIVLASPLKAQVTLSINIISQPVWGPVGYDHVEYYYLPDLDIYYYVPQNIFYYYEKDRWIYGSALPSRYSTFNLFNHYKVIVNEPEPWRKHKYYKEKYYSFRGRHDQQVIFRSNDSKYFINKSHPEHNKWIEKQKHNKRINKIKNVDNNSNKGSKQKNKSQQGNRKK